MDVFDPLQRSIGADRRHAQTAVDQVLSNVGDHSYRDRDKAYRGVRDQLLKAMFASTYVLGSVGDASALILIARLCRRSVVDYFSQVDTEIHAEGEDLLTDRLRAAIGSRLRDAFENVGNIEQESVQALVRDAKKAADQLRRNGFRRDQWSTDTHIRAAHAEAAGELVRLLDEIDRLIAELERLDAPHLPSNGTLADAAKDDCQAFAMVLRQVYSGSASHTKLR